MSKVLVVDDDQVLAKLVADWLKAEKFTVEVVHNGADAKALIQDFHYDAIILDWEMPDVTGLEILEQYRRGGGTALVLMLTGRDQIEDKESGLMKGADDYLTKPFHIKELIARLHAMLRRPRTVYQEELQVGNLRMNPHTRYFSIDDKEIELLPKEFALLECFMRHPGQVFAADALLNRVWKSEKAVNNETVRTCIKRLRQKVDRDGEESRIETLYGAGYRLRIESPEKK
jgi:DNA-binding response OmpR family regulator